MKIDTSTIEGFENLTAEEKLAILLDLDVPDPVDLSGYVSKNIFDKKASEAAELSKKLKAKMTDEEAAQAAQQEAAAAMQKSLDDANAQIAALILERNISKLTSDYLAQGYDKELAAKAATALANGKTDKVMEYAAQFIATREQAIKAELMMNSPTPPGSEGDGVDADVQTAIAFGKTRAEGVKNSETVLSNYIAH